MARFVPFLAAVLAVPMIAQPAIALAQTPAPAAAAALAGPLVPGVCVLSREAVLVNAKVGVAAAARLKTLADQAQAEIDTERTPLTNDLKTFDAQKASLSEAQAKPRQDALSARMAELQRKASVKGRQVEATRLKVMTRISTTAQPVISQVYQAHHCGILFNRDMMLGGNAAADLTAEVVKGLDAQITTLTFDLEPASDAALAQTSAARP